MLGNLVFGPIHGLLGLIGLVILAVKLFALVDAALRPQAAWRAAVPLSKAAWLGILGLSVLLGGLGLFGVAALVATILYLVDVRPKLQEARGRGGSPW